MGRDLTKGSIEKNLVYMAVPTMLGFLSQTLYDIIDMIWIGRISAEAVASVTIFSTVYWVVAILNNIIGISSVSLISQSYGAKDIKMTQKSVEQTITFKFIVAIIAACFLFFTIKPLIKFFTDDIEVFNNALNYGYIRIFFLPITFSMLSINAALRNVGDSKKSMYIMTGSAILNIILDPIFMFDKVPFIGIPGFGLGVFGAALSTVISITIAFVFGFWIIMSGRSYINISLKGLFKLDKELDKKLITIGLPSGIETLLRNLSGVIVLKMVAIYGTAAVAAMGIGNRLLAFVIMPLVGFSTGGSTIVGQNLGVDNIERADKTAKTAVKICTSIIGVAAVISCIFPQYIMKIFVDDLNVINIGVNMIRIFMGGMIFAGVFFGLSTVFYGSGYNLPFLASSIISRWIVQIPMLIIITYVLKMPVDLIWLSFLVSEAVEMIVIIIFYRKGKWKKVRV